MRLPRRGPRPDLELAPGERLLAWSLSSDGTAVGGTRDAVYLPHRIPWEQVAHAEWDREESALRVTEVASYGEPAAVHVVSLTSPGRLVPLVRERVTASIALQRHVGVTDRHSVRVLARRSPGRHGPLSWFVEYDAGLEPADPDVMRVVDDALERAKSDLGD